MEKPMYFEEYEIGAQRKSGGRTITEADIVIHAGQTGDFYPQHMDAEFCKNTAFGQRIAHGTLTFSIGMGLQAADAVNPRAFSYGYDHMRFIKPVFIGDTLHTVVTIKELRDDPKRPGMGFVTEKIEIYKQDGNLAMVCDHIILCEKRPQE